MIKLEQEQKKKKIEDVLNIDVGGSKNKRNIKNKWKIVDISKSADYVINLNKDKLPFEKNKVNNIFCSHTLEHLEPDSIKQVFSEFYRVLRPKYGKIRIVVPDFEKAVIWYIKKNIKKLKDVKNPSKYPALPDLPMGYLSSWIYTPNKGHRMGFDHEILLFYLKQAGFKNITKMSYNKCSKVFKGKDYGRYIDNSIFMEAIK